MPIEKQSAALLAALLEARPQRAYAPLLGIFEESQDN